MPGRHLLYGSTHPLRELRYWHRSYCYCSYALSGTELGHAATRGCREHGERTLGGEIRSTPLSPSRTLCDVRYCDGVCDARPTRVLCDVRH
eukprot:1381690-Rhodomonas_salina.5